MNKEKTILVTGATGQQGGSVARHLLEQGWSVRAFVRDNNKPNAQTLGALGAELVQGDLEDVASIDAAMVGVYGVFSFPNMAMGLEKEIEHGKRVADSAKSAGMQHFVQSSVGGADRNSGVPHFESKRQIELYVEELGLPATIVRPVYFMENLNWKRQAILDGTLESMGMSPDKPLQLISVDDIGRITAHIFANPEQFIGQGVEIAGDELSETQMADVFSKVLSREVELTPLSTPHQYGDMAIMVQWFEDFGYQADIDTLKSDVDGLLSFEDWIKTSNWRA